MQRLFLLLTSLLLIFLGTGVHGAAPRVVLQVEVEASSGMDFRWTVRCSPNGGSHPNLKDVCKKLKKKSVRDLFSSVKQENCTQVFGSKANARVSGRIYGSRVKLQLDRRDGCGVALWQRLDFILVKQ